MPEIELELLPVEEYQLLVGVLEQAERQAAKALCQPSKLPEQEEATLHRQTGMPSSLWSTAAL